MRMGHPPVLSPWGRRSAHGSAGCAPDLVPQTKHGGGTRRLLTYLSGSRPTRRAAHFAYVMNAIFEGSCCAGPFPRRVRDIRTPVGNTWSPAGVAENRLGYWDFEWEGPRAGEPLCVARGVSFAAGAYRVRQLLGAVVPGGPVQLSSHSRETPYRADALLAQSTADCRATPGAGFYGDGRSGVGARSRDVVSVAPPGWWLSERVRSLASAPHVVGGVQQAGAG